MYVFDEYVIKTNKQSTFSTFLQKKSLSKIHVS